VTLDLAVNRLWWLCQHRSMPWWVGWSFGYVHVQLLCIGWVYQPLSGLDINAGPLVSNLSVAGSCYWLLPLEQIVNFYVDIMKCRHTNYVQRMFFASYVALKAERHED